MKKYTFYIILCVIILFVYNRWFLSLDIVAHGDWGYLVNLTGGHFDVFTWRSVFSNGGILLDMAQFSRFFYSFLGSLGLNYEISERIIFLWPLVILSTIGFFKLGKYIFKSDIAGLFASIVFCFNTYVLTLHTGHITLAASFSVFPWIFLVYDKFLKRGNIKYMLYTILWFILSVGYEPRSAYIMAFVLLFYTIFYLIKDNIIRWKGLFVGLILCVILNVRRYLPLSHSLGDISNNEIFNRGLFGGGFFNLLYSFVLHHPFWSGGSIMVFDPQPIPMYFWLIPVVAFVGFFVNKKNRYIQFFGIIALLGIFLSKQSSEPFAGVYLWLYENFPGFNAFREASKFYFLVVIGYSILIAGFVSYLESNRTINKYIRYGLISIIAMLFLYNAKPIVTKEIGTLFVARYMPKDYEILNNFLLKNKQYGRTLSVPGSSRWMFYGNRAPKLSIIDELGNTYKSSGYTGKNMFDQIKSFYSMDQSNLLMDRSSIRYIILPLVDFENDDDFFKDYGDPYEDPRNNSLLTQKQIEQQSEIRSKRLYNEYYQILSNVAFLEEINIGTNEVRIFENKGYQPLLHSLSGLQYKFINPTKYSLNLTIPANSTGEELSFLQSFHDEWKLYPGQQIQTGDCTSTAYYSGGQETFESDALTDSGSTYSGAVISGGVMTYTVQSGDTLRGVVTRYGYDYDQIIILNPYVSLTPRAGSLLTLKLPKSATTRSGSKLDTMGSLSTGQMLSGDLKSDPMTRGPTTECVRDGYTFFQGEELGYLRAQPLRDDSHEMVYDYANGWTIDLNTGFVQGEFGGSETYLQQGLRQGWITPNTDGSYNVSLTLYFRPQSRFYLGLLISGTTLLGLIGWLLWSYRPKSKNQLSHQSE